MSAATCIITMGTPEVRRGKPVHIERNGPWDEIRQKVTVFDEPNKTAARATAGATPNAANPDFANFFVVESPARKLPNWPGWEFDIVWLGTFDATKRQRVTNTLSDQISWSNAEDDDDEEEQQEEDDEGLKVSYEMLIPRMTVSDIYVSTSQPVWSQQGLNLVPPSPPSPPTTPPFTSDDVIIHVPWGWVLTSRTGEQVGSAWQVNDTFTYFDEARPGNI